MLDVFTEEVEKIIKEGISNFRWYRGDLKKILLGAKVDFKLCEELFCLKNEDGRPFSKRQIMDRLYEILREAEFNRRLEISRNLVRVLVEATEFKQEDPGHKVMFAQNSALRLKEIIRKQDEQASKRQILTTEKKSESYNKLMEGFSKKFEDALKLPPQQRGYKLEKLFPELMNISGILVQESFKIEGEQIDGAIKYDGRYYLLELKWQKEKVNQADIASLFMKVEGKIDGTRGIFISMNGYSDDVVNSLPTGKKIKVFLLDGMHLSNVIYQQYTFQQLLDYAIGQASMQGCIYCDTRLGN